jgi:5-methylcytosine-specific restriction enzyme subunit McrC
MGRDLITKFEHEKLLLKEQEVDEHLLETLQRYHGTKGTPYFSLIHKGVKFNQYVGVIQVGRKQIEVLPKVDRLDNDEVNWRSVLMQMLRLTSGIEAKATSQSQLRVQQNSIFDLYIELFINECEKLTHRGLIKRYQRRRENKQALKGRLDIPGQIRHNLVHKERFHVDYSSYEHDHLINQILKKTLVVLARLSSASLFQGRIKRQLLYFEDVADFIPTTAAFNAIRYGRKNSHYKKAIQIARLILLNYHPDISRGQQHVLALMFDMNALWEKYIAMQMRRHLSYRFEVKTQKKQAFWQSDNKMKHLKPDIVLTDREDDSTIIIDTKWKIPEKMVPGDQDLRQMFAYNRLFDSKRSILLYPGRDESVQGMYQTEKGGECRLVTLPVMDSEGALIRDESLFESLKFVNNH